MGLNNPICVSKNIHLGLCFYQNIFISKCSFVGLLFEKLIVWLATSLPKKLHICFLKPPLRDTLQVEKGSIKWELPVDYQLIRNLNAKVVTNHRPGKLKIAHFYRMVSGEEGNVDDDDSVDSDGYKDDNDLAITMPLNSISALLINSTKAKQNLRPHFSQWYLFILTKKAMWGI